MSDEALQRALDEFERLYFPIIHPDPKYANVSVNQAERNRMIAAGQRAAPHMLSPVARACLEGNYEGFLREIKLRPIKNFNTWFEGEARLSLLHQLAFGRKLLLMKSLPLDIFNHLSIAKYLLEHDLFIDIQSKWGYSSLHEVVINCPDIEFARFLLKNGADPNLKCIFGDTPLLSTVMDASIECMKLLCDYGADPRVAEFSGITPLSMCHHIEAMAILHNAKRKLELKVNSLPHEDVNYCKVCSVSSKIKKLHQCSRCKGPERYCSKKCQKSHWPKHKKLCNVNRLKVGGNGLIDKDDHKKSKQQQEVVLITQNAQGLIAPSAPVLTDASELAAALLGQTGLESHRLRNQKKRERKYKRQSKKFGKRNLKNKIPKRNKQFVIKIQWSPQHPDEMFIYNQSRKYAVMVMATNQSKMFKKLKNSIRQNGLGAPKLGPGKKAYFNAWVDNKQRLHVLTGNVLAFQPW